MVGQKAGEENSRTVEEKLKKPSTFKRLGQDSFGGRIPKTFLRASCVPLFGILYTSYLPSYHKVGSKGNPNIDWKGLRILTTLTVARDL